MERNADPTDRRVFVRHPTDVPVELRTPADEEPDCEPSVDVSFGGVCVQSSRLLPIGTEVQLRYPHLAPDKVITGTVAWCALREPGCYDVGVQFEHPNEGFVMRMVEQLCQIEHYKHELEERENREIDGNAAAEEWIRHHSDDFPGLAE